MFLAKWNPASVHRTRRNVSGPDDERESIFMVLTLHGADSDYIVRLAEYTSKGTIRNIRRNAADSRASDKGP